MSKKKGNDMLGFVMDNAAMNIGITGSAGIVGAMPNNPMKNSVLKGMETMSILPTIHASSGIFSQLQNLNKTVKKKK